MYTICDCRTLICSTWNTRCLDGHIGLRKTCLCFLFCYPPPWPLFKTTATKKAAAEVHATSVVVVAKGRHLCMLAFFFTFVFKWFNIIKSSSDAVDGLPGADWEEFIEAKINPPAPCGPPGRGALIFQACRLVDLPISRFPWLQVRRSPDFQIGRKVAW